MTIRCLSKELQAKAIAELNEDPERILQDLRHLKEWLKKQPHIKARTGDQWLLSFLRGCKYSLERTKKKLDMYYTVRTIAREFFENRNPFLPEIQEVLKLGIFLPLLQTKGPDTPRILLVRQGIFDPTKYDIIAVFKVLGMIADILLNEDDLLVIAGTSIFLDCKGMSLAHASVMTPAFAKKIVTIFQGAYPPRPKAFHFCNVPSFFASLFKSFKPFLGEKILKKMKIYSPCNLDEIYETIPKSIFPKEYGGDAGEIQELIDFWKLKVENYREWFTKDSYYCTEESKRPGKPKTTNDIFGIEGSFRKLNVD